MTSDEILKQAQYINSTTRMIRVQTSGIKRELEKESDGNIPEDEFTATQFLAMEAIDQHGLLTIKDLANILGISSPSTTVLVDKMVERGIFTREQSQEDRRKVIVRISPAAAEIGNRIKEIYRNKLDG